MEILYVVKIGGNIIDDEQLLSSFLKKFAAIRNKKILIHGGGKLATRIAEKMGIPQQIIISMLDKVTAVDNCEA